MASQTMIEPQLKMSDIPRDLLASLSVTETENEFLVRTFSGATLSHPKLAVHYWWQLMTGIWDNGTDTTEERGRERERELAHDERKLDGERA